MEWKLHRNALAAAVVAIPLVCIADDRDADKSTATPEKTAETRPDVNTRTLSTQSTYEGRLVNLHQYMTGAATASTTTIDANRSTTTVGPSLSLAQGQFALETTSGLILLSPQATPAGTVGSATPRPSPGVKSRIGTTDNDDNVAGIDRDASDSDSSDGGAKGQSRISTKEPGAAAAQARINNRAATAQADADDSGVYGIERADLDKAGQRIKATGTLMTKGGIRYLVVSSVTPVSAAGTDPLLDRDARRRSNSTERPRDTGNNTDDATDDNPR